MYLPADIALWTGRVDPDDGGDARRWHQVVRACPLEGSHDKSGGRPATVLLGFASDTGVRRNHGRPGAAEGPAALRRALANLPWHGGDAALLDAGDVRCEGDELEDAQAEYGARLAEHLRRGEHVIGLGGGHEIAWASYQGIAKALAGDARLARLGILNFDAHLDMRPLDADGRGSSGTPFRQIADARAAAGLPFRYLCVGASRASNTASLIDAAQARGVEILYDWQCNGAHEAAAAAQIAAFVRDCSALYLTLCLDVLPASVAPGVSAPAALGVAPQRLLVLLHAALAACRADDADNLLVADIAELAPPLDREGRTARVAARLAFELFDGFAGRSN